jgi:NAD(P)-dependent dehydrogenase (short-subunit alcohol dehydrogenase family)
LSAGGSSPAVGTTADGRACVPDAETTWRKLAVLLKDKVAIVTGAGSGIGQGIAMRFATEGAKVVVAELHQRKAAATAAQIAETTSSEALAVPTNVARLQDVNAMVTKTLERFGRIDVLVNNTGIRLASPIVEMSDEEWHNTLATNLTGGLGSSNPPLSANRSHICLHFWRGQKTPREMRGSFCPQRTGESHLTPNSPDPASILSLRNKNGSLQRPGMRSGRCSVKHRHSGAANRTRIEVRTGIAV